LSESGYPGFNFLLNLYNGLKRKSLSLRLCSFATLREIIFITVTFQANCLQQCFAIAAKLNKALPFHTFDHFYQFLNMS